jgi:hypothetical protein
MRIMAPGFGSTLPISFDGCIIAEKGANNVVAALFVHHRDQLSIDLRNAT